jgi:SecD/SecF fusion protein
MRHPLLLLALVIGLVAASVVAIALKPATLGLDLQGGVEVVLQGQPTEQSAVTDEAIDRSIEIIRGRVDAFGVAEPEIQKQGKDQIIVSLPGVDDPQTVVEDLIRPAQLLFFDFEDSIEGSGPEAENGNPSLWDVVKLAQRTTVRNPDRGEPSFYAFDKKTHRLIEGPTVDEQSLRELFPNDTIPSTVTVQKVPRGLFIPYEERGLATRGDDGPTQRYYYLFQYNPQLSGSDVTEARSVLDTQSFGGNQYVVTLKFTGKGRDAFQSITRDLAVRGQLRGVSQRFAIVLDRQIVTNPTVDPERFPTGISGRDGAQIEGNFSQKESQRLADQLNSGAIPIELEPISRKQVGATLGRESLHEGLIAGISGLVLVLLFLIVYYRVLGLVAAAGLLIYAALLYAVIVLVPITLTLPGIAGIILTIGVAADANVVIFERVREEARAGRNARTAILNGYSKGFKAILDANIVTLSTAVILFLFATAGVKGFAFTLFIGVLLSLFTAVVATRAVFGVLAGTGLMANERFLGLKQREIRWKLDMVGRWKLWMAISFVPLAIGSIFIGTHGLNLGLDFESGTRIVSSFEKPTTENDIRDALSSVGIGNARVQATTENVDGKDVRGFQIQTETLDTQKLQEVQRVLDQRFGFPETPEIEVVGATFGEQVIENALIAIILSFLIITAYLTIRFEYKLALPALLSVVHDVWLSIAVYSVAGAEVTSATVAALLTILGYSLYDVVIVFDRIRENVPLMRSAPYRQVVNRSVHEVLTRTLITQATTLLPILALYFFGGDTLKDFALALLVGILAGGLSSIGIAAPLAALWKEREPADKKVRVKAERRARRLGTDSDVVDIDALERAERALAAELDDPRGASEDGPRERFELEPGEVEIEYEEEVEEPAGADGADRPAAPEERAPAAEAADGASPDGRPADGEPDDGTPRAEPAPPRPDRVRRHRQVQRKRRK